MTFNYNKVFYHGKSALLVKVLVYIIITYKMSVLPSDIIYLVYIVPLILIDHKKAIRLWRNWSFKILFIYLVSELKYHIILLSFLILPKKKFKNPSDNDQYVHLYIWGKWFRLKSDMLQCSLTEMRNFSRVSWATVIS